MGVFWMLLMLLMAGMARLSICRLVDCLREISTYRAGCDVARSVRLVSMILDDGDDDDDDDDVSSGLNIAVA
ncbi:uncharacterized protein P174DRAFT_109313 [Aspergillus novofumigatus IBT 16806]|uniref:Secreted protein n=1 Tax=Aspergillus novofumigatus (strain IBT 16806) TaxID=1392255 RepID=A0A2I1CID0_ASPN1|nr:uncharacterized protein P174DRAFT_109313 [Aspergillus novofumigatus IBT 16806]PKX97395.1 hypothetical protein P174DRAFT_109313 [Aspergillus novofumigatus IBT 16806]